MNLETVRILKREIAEEVVRPRIRALHAERRAVRAVGMRRLTDVWPGVALGISQGDGPGDYKLAVRMQRRSVERDAILRKLIIGGVGADEVEFNYIGQVLKGGLRKRVPNARAMQLRPWYQQRQRPLLVGISVGHALVTAGTLGLFGLHVKSGRIVMVSNNHVLANENKAKLGDQVLQPGAYDGGKRGLDEVANLLAFVPLRPEMNNLVDAAAAAVNKDVLYDPATLKGKASLAGLRSTTLLPGDEVFKIGRTTGLTQGVVTAIEVDDVVVSYERGEFGFDSQIEIASGEGQLPFSSGGDSGSLIFDSEGNGCALLFAGSDTGGPDGLGVTYANDLALALELLDVNLLIDNPGC